MNPLLESLGVQARPFRALVRTFATMDLRGQLYGMSTGAKAGELIPPLFWVFGQMLTVSVLLCACLQGRVDARFYAFANLTVAAMMVFSAVVVEFHEAAFDPEDVRVIGHRPVTSRTWSLARFVNLVGYVGLVGVAVTVFPAIMGLGLRDTDAMWLLRYPLASGLVCISSASAALTLYVLGGFGARFDGLRQAMAWVQIGGILALFYGGQFMLRNGTGVVSEMSYAPPEWVLNLPTWHFAPAVSSGVLTPWLVAVGVTTALTAVALYGLQRAWSGVASITSAPIRAIGSRGLRSLAPSWLDAWPRRTGAIYGLVARLFRRDSEMRSRTWPALGMAVTLPIIGTFAGEYGAPVSGLNAAGIVPIGTVVVLCGAVPSILHNLRFSRDYRAAYSLIPFWDGQARDGVRLAVFLRFLVPLIALHTVLISVLWRDVWAVVSYTAIALCLTELVTRLCVRSQLTEPIASRPWSRGSSFGSISIVVAGVSALASVLGGGWWLSTQHPIAHVAYPLLLSTVSFAIGRYDRRTRA